MTSAGEQGYHEKGGKVMESGDIFNSVAATNFKMWVTTKTVFTYCCNVDGHR